MLCKNCPRGHKEFILNDYAPQDLPIWMYSCPFEEFNYRRADNKCCFGYNESDFLAFRQVKVRKFRKVKVKRYIKIIVKIPLPVK